MKSDCNRARRIPIWILFFLSTLALLCALPLRSVAQCVTPTNTVVTRPLAGAVRSYQELLLCPSRVAVDPTGNLYVTDSRQGRVVIYDAFGRVRSAQENFAGPLGIAIDAAGNIYLGEQQTHSVAQYDNQWNFVRKLGAGDNEVFVPNHLAIDPASGDLFVSDSSANEVKAYHNGALALRFGTYGIGAGQFDFPAGIFVSASDEVFVVDQNNDRVQVFNTQGVFQRCFALRTKKKSMFEPSLSGRAQGITGDNAGRIYVADSFQGVVKVFDTRGFYLSSIGQFGTLMGQLSSPAGVALDSFNRLCVASANNARVEVFGLDSFIDLQMAPASQFVCAGTNVSFTVYVGGSGPFNYQWKKSGIPLSDGGNVSGAASATLVLTAVTLADAGTYAVDITTPSGPITGPNATLAVMEPPMISVQPIPQTAMRGTPAAFNVVATGSSLSFQWQRNGAPIPGATDSALQIAKALPYQTGEYSLVVANPVGSTVSTEAHLEVLDDLDSPLVKLVSPKTSAVFTNADEILLTGTARDNGGIEQVICSVGNGESVSATLSSGGVETNWSASVHLGAGANMVTVTAYDFAGSSSTEYATLYNRVASLFTLSVNGDGGVLPLSSGQLGTPTNGASLFVGYTYKLLAKAGTNWVLTNWTSSALGEPTSVLETNNPTLTFVMKSNLVLTANFIPNPLLSVAGWYRGLFFEPDEVRHHSAGYIAFKVDPRFKTTGKLFVDGNAITFSGKVRLDGTIDTIVRRQAVEKDNLNLRLVLDLANATDVTTGTLADPLAGWSANILADRSPWNTNTGNQATNYANKYTVVMPASTNSASAPATPGWMTVSVRPLGEINAGGKLADMGVVRLLPLTTVISKTGKWPLFASLYPHKRMLSNSNEITETFGELIGWLNFETNTMANTTNLAPQGTLDWIKLASAGSNYPNGFTNQNDVLGSRWLVVSNESPLAVTNGIVTLAGDYLPQTAEIPVFLTNNSLFNAAGATNVFRATIHTNNGTISGWFQDPLFGSAVGWRGVLLQDQASAIGSFLSRTNPGTLIIDPTP